MGNKKQRRRHISILKDDYKKRNLIAAEKLLNKENVLGSRMKGNFAVNKASELLHGIKNDEQELTPVKIHQ